MWNTIAMSDKGSKKLDITNWLWQVKDHGVEWDNPNMVGKIQVIINGLRFLGRNVDTYDVIDKVLSTFPP